MLGIILHFVVTHASKAACTALPSQSLQPKGKQTDHYLNNSKRGVQSATTQTAMNGPI